MATSPAVSLNAWAERQPLASRFFESALSQRRLAHAYLLKGGDVEAQYAMALTLAQLLNCLEPPDPLQACGHCRNCKWIAANAHPAVMTVTRLNYDAPQDTSTAKKVIRTQQIHQLLQSLSLTSAETRVVIFCDAEVLPATVPSHSVPPSDWQLKEENATKSFHIRPLTRQVFSEKSVNQFLKTLEEPHPGTLFFFLAESEDSLLPTIVSRCQVVPFLPKLGQSQDRSLHLPEAAAFFDQWWPPVAQRRGNPYELAASFRQFWEETQGLDVAYGLRQLQQWLASGSGTLPLKEWRQWHLALEKAIEQSVAKVHLNSVLWHLLSRESAERP